MKGIPIYSYVCMIRRPIHCGDLRIAGDAYMEYMGILIIWVSSSYAMGIPIYTDCRRCVLGGYLYTPPLSLFVFLLEFSGLQTMRAAEIILIIWVSSSYVMRIPIYIDCRRCV